MKKFILLFLITSSAYSQDLDSQLNTHVKNFRLKALKAPSDFNKNKYELGKSLFFDNILSGKYKNNSDIGSPSKKYFNDEVKKYAYMWREGGQFSTEKYNPKENIDN